MGITFGTVRGGSEGQLVAAVHPPTILLAGLGLNDKEFELFLQSINAMIDTVYRLTDRDPDIWSLDSYPEVRTQMYIHCPDFEEMLAKVWDQRTDN